LETRGLPWLLKTKIALIILGQSFDFSAKLNKNQSKIIINSENLRRIWHMLSQYSNSVVPDAVANK
jgi:hypothetical protein